MNGGNGSEALEEEKLLFQKDTFKGVDNRKDRLQVSQIEQLIIDNIREIKGDIKAFKTCKEQCNIHPELAQRQDHIVGVIKDSSSDGTSVEKGLNEIAKNNRFIKNLREAVNQGSSSFITSTFKAIGWFILMLIGLGLIDYLKTQGVM